MQSGRQSGSQKRELEGDCHQLDPVSEVASVWQWCWRVLIAPELMCLFLTPGAPGFNYCLRSHMQMSLQSFLVPMDGSPDYQPSHFAARWAGRRGGGTPLARLASPLRADKQNRIKWYPACPIYGSLWADKFKVVSGESLLPEGTGRLLVNSRGALEDLNSRSPWGQRIFTGKERHWEDVSLQKRPWTRSGRLKSSCLQETVAGDFPGGLIVKTPAFHCRGHRFDPWARN